MRRGFLLTAGIPMVLATVSAAGCTVGNGSGYADGMLWILGCEDGSNYGSETAPAEFHLSPTYFAGEPIEDIGDAKPAHNRIIMRIQRNGNALEITDTLYVDVPFSYEVAQCLRGRTVGGVPDWDTTTGTVDPTVTQPWCGPIGANGVPVINLVPYGPVNVSLTPFGTCHSQAHPPTVIGVTGVAQQGTIEFLDFGSAAQPTLAPDARTPVDGDFKVAYGDRLHAFFNITLLQDERVTNAIRLNLSPPPDPIIGGTLAGEFDFDLERGRSAQTFP
jgi:hypothetical protein